MSRGFPSGVRLLPPMLTALPRSVLHCCTSQPLLAAAELSPDKDVNFQCPSLRFTIEEFESGLRYLVLARPLPKPFIAFVLLAWHLCRQASF